jgi:ubiquinone/menaquinone biosynthesis C-methylase UbiE
MKNKKQFDPMISKAPTEKLWNDVWFNNKNILFHEPVIHQIIKLESISTILEVGAGTGADLLELKRLGYKVIFSDFSSVAIKNIKKVDPQLTTIKCDARDLPFNKNSFDLVYCLGLLEHFNYSDRQKIISELFRVSKNYVLIDVPQSNTLTSLIKHILMKIGKWKYGNEIEFSYKKLNYEINKSTKENKKIYSVYGRELIPIPRHIKNKFYLKSPKILREKYIFLINKIYYLCGCLGIIYKK